MTRSAAPLSEERLGDLLDHAPLGALAHSDQHRPLADRLHVTAFERGPAEVGHVELALIAHGRVPPVELGVAEHRVIPIDRQHVERFAPPRRPVHRVDRDAVVDPAGGVTHEERVRQRRENEGLDILKCRRDQGDLACRAHVETGFGHGHATDQVRGQRLRVESPRGSRAPRRRWTSRPCRARQPPRSTCDGLRRWRPVFRRADRGRSRPPPPARAAPGRTRRVRVAPAPPRARRRRGVRRGWRGSAAAGSGPVGGR